ncbi:TetR/AcrR family transcriptional regulator [uncultured Peptoniphilus sp.]|uniref:TetR/AcrR family transcriptional regulator n=1 Tax=uncultured Peptoniphilus sp. TaxID=254354 RepID=UPI002803AD0A|nr:TetR/AcrR family transcriptional regulator [uncultured Peptoniphilus sp.]
MSNNENTKAKILEVASHLFLSKGYDETRISDIINGLDGLTKGAIYHYFDSKEDIFNEVVSEIGNKNLLIFEEIKNDETLNAREKLSKLIEVSFYNENMNTITDMSPSLLDNPKLLSAIISEIKDITIPNYILPIINSGVKDGSIKTTHPEELSELIAILLNIWLNPLIFSDDKYSIVNKMKLINNILQNFDIKLFTDELIEKFNK